MNNICAVVGCYRPAKRRGWCPKHYTRWYNHGDPEKTLTAEKGSLLKWIEEHKDFNGDDCLIWPFGRITDGYCQVLINGKAVRVNRLMCEYRNGPPPSKRHEAAHSCGRGSDACVNPQHLRWTTTAGNQQERVKHGTSNRGTRQWLAKLDELKVREIRASSESKVELSKRFGVCLGTIESVLRRTNWAWVD